jgi:hypothetical protein
MRSRIVALILGAAMLLAASTAVAGWFDDFSGNLDAWDFDSITGTGGTSSTFNPQIVSGVLEFTDSNPVATGGAAIGLGYVDQIFVSTVAYGTLNPNGDSNINQGIGVFVRGDGDNAYALRVDYGTGNVDIVKNSATGQTTLGAVESIDGFQSTDSLYVELWAFGTTLTGSVYDPVSGALLERFSRTDSDYPGGVAGVFTQYGVPTVGIRGAFDDVGANAPEPGSLILLGSGGLCALGCWWRKRRRKA